MLGPAAHAKSLRGRSRVAEKEELQELADLDRLVGDQVRSPITGDGKHRHALGERQIAGREALAQHGDEQKVGDPTRWRGGVGIRRLERLTVAGVEQYVSGTRPRCRPDNDRRCHQRRLAPPHVSHPPSALLADRSKGPPYHTTGGRGNAHHRAAISLTDRSRPRTIAWPRRGGCFGE